MAKLFLSAEEEVNGDKVLSEVDRVEEELVVSEEIADIVAEVNTVDKAATDTDNIINVIEKQSDSEDEDLTSIQAIAVEAYYDRLGVTKKVQLAREGVWQDIVVFIRRIIAHIGSLLIRFWLWLGSWKKNRTVESEKKRMELRIMAKSMDWKTTGALYKMIKEFQAKMPGKSIDEVAFSKEFIDACNASDVGVMFTQMDKDLANLSTEDFSSDFLNNTKSYEQIKKLEEQLINLESKSAETLEAVQKYIETIKEASTKEECPDKFIIENLIDELKAVEERNKKLLEHIEPKAAAAKKDSEIAQKKFNELTSKYASDKTALQLIQRYASQYAKHESAILKVVSKISHIARKTELALAKAVSASMNKSKHMASV